jgi:CheY-like chemotaxis protein
MDIIEGTSKDIFTVPGRNSRTLLIVDSDPQNVLYVQLLLQRFEFQTHSAQSAREVFALANAATTPALILTAVGLKDMSGLNMMKLLRQSAKTANIPFITMRRPEDAVGERHCFNAGAVACLSKPISAELLYRALQGALEERPRMTMRIRTIQPVQVETAPYEGAEGMHTLDMSERGLFLRTPKPAPENARLSLKLNLNGATIPLVAKVIYTCPPCKGRYDEPGMGLQFVHLSSQDLEHIRHFLNHEVMRGIVPEKEDSPSSKNKTS